MADIENIDQLDDEAFEEAQFQMDEDVENAPEISDEVTAEEASEEEAEPEVQEEEESPGEETALEDETEEVVDEVSDDEPDNEPEEETDEDESPETETETEEFDYQSSYEEVLKPLKVSGKDVQVKSADDLRNLASMGIDYSRKMRDIKPLRAVGETLANAGLIKDGVVDAEALTRLIDISKGDKEAIASLLQEQGIDSMDLEPSESQYTPKTEMVSQGTLELADVENELNSRGTTDQVVNALQQFDVKSKQFFNESPSNLLKLEQDIQSGVYEEVMGSVEYERSLGRLGGLSDIEAYVKIATANVSQQVQEEAPEPVVEQKPKPSSAKRKAAGISKRAPAKNTQKTYDYLNMSDEEFEKLTPDTGMY